MRYRQKTDYLQDIRLLGKPGQAPWYVALGLLLLAAPFVLDNYWLSQLNFVLIYAIAGVGLMLLAGFTGLLSLGHAAFLGVGAYTQAVLVDMGVPFPLSMLAAAVLSALVGAVVGLPALRVKGIYLAIATLAFGLIVEEVFARWESVTGGNGGLLVPSPQLFGVSLGATNRFYWLALITCILVTLLVVNLLRTPTGRAFVAIRDSEISAQSMGINLALYKTASFALSAAIVGVAGALYAHQLRYLSPEQFGILQSIDLLMLVVVGGLGAVQGAFIGAAFLIAAPQLISLLRDYLPGVIGQAPGLQSVVFGLVVILVVMFEPQGLYGRWVRIRTYFELFPIYRKGLMRRQRAFQKSERLH
ncbi:branched-chain amino acid ABC transporter permease [Pseudooceanicola aestuarii]|uniref:branched-chain amino acid ABC transporter permease n=1 Tax=Pseudooceanicola aestuarii TaxID=2697319 RepID=UPI0013D3ADD5|nr:branched-chain amino acid ABC transporter permease [Pseudooceanicola aestuarii]